MSDDIFRVLKDQPAPAPRVRVEDVLTAGRAKVRARRAGTVAAAAAAVLAIVAAVVIVWSGEGTRRTMPVGPLPTTAPGRTPSSPSPAARKCTAAQLAPAGATRPEVFIQGMDPSGRYIVGELGAQQGRGVVLWTDGVPRILSTNEADEPTAVNSSGVVVGRRTNNKIAVPIKSVNGAFVTLPMPKGAVAATATAINTRGDIVGYAVFEPVSASGSVPALSTGAAKAVMWPAGAPQTPRLLPGGMRMSQAFAVDDDGTVAGGIDDGEQPYMWHPDGRGEALAQPADRPGGWIMGIRGDWAFGVVDYLKDSVLVPTVGRRMARGLLAYGRWNLATGQVESLERFTPSGLADDGTLVGYQSAIDGPVVWRDGTGRQLPGLPGKPVGGVADRISADGRIVVGRLFEGQTPVIWHC
jgi:hypothetical protein